MGLGNNFILLTCRNNHFDAQTDISQRDKVLFFVAPCRLFTENSMRACLMLVAKIQCPKNFKMEKKNDHLVTKKKKKKKKKNASLKGWKHDTCMCIFDESVGRCRQYK